VYDATTSAPVVHMKAYAGGGSEVSIEYWIFPPDRAVWIKGQTTTVYDAETAANSDMRRAIRGRISGLYDLWPLEVSQSAIPTREKYDGLDKYELEWPVGETTYVWRAKVDQETHRVQGVKRWVNDPVRGLIPTWSFEVH
jgi:hypothetical protein